jgi:hypothetical protein
MSRSSITLAASWKVYMAKKYAMIKYDERPRIIERVPPTTVDLLLYAY